MIRIDGPADLSAAYAFAARATASHRVASVALVAEVYFDGPEVSIEVVMDRGHYRPSPSSIRRSASGGASRRPDTSSLPP
ncbi:hypothetical protein ABZZ37_16080 [Streptomyces sp. NPDC006464]|uniref:hypothetical protein n=1 Tax=Streptomyces sp. NPDC006464 TaxID=3154305 RepID=UPI0033B39E6B